MKNRFSGVLGSLLLLIIPAIPSFAENKIQAYVAPDGKVVFTNMVDDNPVSIATAPPEAIPSSIGSGAIHALIEAIATNHGVDPALVKAMVKTESNFNRWAISSKGALGLMQLIPNTGLRFGVRDFFDPKQNIEGGVSYIKFLLEKFKGDLDLSLAAYNAGENLVERLGRIPSIPETRDYVRKVRANYGKRSVPVVASTVVEAKADTAPPASEPPQQVFRTVDERGVVHFSNLAPLK